MFNVEVRLRSISGIIFVCTFPIAHYIPTLKFKLST